MLPDDGETADADKAKKLAFRLIPQFGTEITADTLFDLTCVVSSYRKPETLGRVEFGKERRPPHSAQTSRATPQWESQSGRFGVISTV